MNQQERKLFEAWQELVAEQETNPREVSVRIADGSVTCTVCGVRFTPADGRPEALTLHYITHDCKDYK